MKERVKNLDWHNIRPENVQRFNLSAQTVTSLSEIMLPMKKEQVIHV